MQLPVLKEGTLKHAEMVLLTKISRQTCSLLFFDIPREGWTESIKKYTKDISTCRIILGLYSGHVTCF